MTSGRFHIRETETYTVSKNKKMSKIKYTSLHASKIIYIKKENNAVPKYMMRNIRDNMQNDANKHENRSHFTKSDE